MFGATSGGDLSDGAVGLAIVFSFLVIGLIVAAISYVCYKAIKKRQAKRVELIDDGENNGSLLEDEKGDRLSDEGLAPEDM